MAYTKSKRTEAQKAAFYGAITFEKKPKVKKYSCKSAIMKRKAMDAIEDQRLLDELNDDDELEIMRMKEFNELMK